MNEHDDLLPQKLMTGSLWMAAACLAGAFIVSITTQQTVNGEVVSFMDYGAIGGSAAAVLFALVSLKDALSPLAGSKKLPRLGLIGVLSAVAIFRFLFGMGMFV